MTGKENNMTAAQKNMLLALFPDINPASLAVDKLREMGISDEHVNVISGLPITEAMMGRKPHPSHVPMLSMLGALGGLALGVFLAFGTPNLYPLNVGGQPLVPGPPSVVVIFEMVMLGMLLNTFLGVFLDSRFPSYTPKEYVVEISDGKIALLIECEEAQEQGIKSAMKQIGAESVKHAEANIL
jgi:hypothetical protein